MKWPIEEGSPTILGVGKNKAPKKLSYSNPKNWALFGREHEFGDP